MWQWSLWASIIFQYFWRLRGNSAQCYITKMMSFNEYLSIKIIFTLTVNCKTFLWLDETFYHHQKNVGSLNWKKKKKKKRQLCNLNILFSDLEKLKLSSGLLMLPKSSIKFVSISCQVACLSSVTNGVQTHFSPVIDAWWSANTQSTEHTLFFTNQTERTWLSLTPAQHKST